jgi:MFS transporter, FSR family, fosmidomycin resistance protein
MLTNRIARQGLLHTSSGLAAFLALSHLMTDAVTGTFLALLPSLQARFALSETTLAFLAATLSFSASITQPFFGALADRFGRRQVGALGMLLSVTLLGLITIAPRVEVLFGLLLVGGLGSAAFHPAMAGLVRTTTRSHGELAVGFFSAAGTVGMAIGPVLILLVVADRGLDVAPWLMLPGLLVALALLITPTHYTPASEGRPPAQFIDARLLAGPVGWLSLTGVLGTLAYLTFSHTMPLWLVRAHGAAPASAVIGWTLASFSLAAAAGGMAAGVLARRIGIGWLISATLALAPLPLWGVLVLPPGTLVYYLAVVLAGALVNAGLPLMIVKAQDLAPHAVGTVSGMLMGFSAGVASLLYIGVGRLRELWGLEAAMALSYAVLFPAAALAWYTLRGERAARRPARKVAIPACLCTPCLEPNIAAFPEPADRSLST